MQLEGSCHCGSVRFSLDTPESVPDLRCFCSICRKTAGSGGFGVNLGARVKGMTVDGAEHIRIYDPIGGREDGSGRRFCGNCGSPLWNWDGRWPDFIHPHVGAIDTPLPIPPVHVDMMLESAPEWARSGLGAPERTFDGYPDEALADLHEHHGLRAE